MTPPDAAPDRREQARKARSSLRRLFALAGQEKNRLLLGAVFLVVGALASLLYPQGMKRVIDAALGERSAAVIDRAAIGMAIVSVVFGISIAARFYIFTYTGERIVNRLRGQLYSAILDQEIAFFDERRTGELTSRLSSDTQVLQNAVSVNVSMALRNLAQGIGGIGFLLWTSPVLTLLMLAVVPAVALGAVTYGRRVRRLAREVQDAIASAGEIAEESIAGVRTVRAYGAEPKEVARYSSALDKALGLARRRVLAGSTFLATASTASFAAAALVFWYGGRLVARGQLSVGGLTSFLMYTLIVAFALGGLADLWADFMRAAGAADRIFEILDRAPAIPVAGGDRPSEVHAGVTLEGLRFAYPSRADVPVLRDLDLQIAPGEIVALVGPSGGGKSTIAALIGRLYDPQGGRVAWDGRDVRTLDPRWLRAQIGVVAQEPILFSTSIAENIRYGRPDATDDEVQAAAKIAHVDGFATKFPQGYATLVGERGVQLSGGQKQRVAIARAVLKDPRLLVLDEATSALDAESEQLVKDALDILMKGRTTLIIAHRLSTVMSADRVVVIDGGRVAESGPHANLMAQGGLYRKLVEKQLVA